jgi:hypothetical protein
VETCNKGEHNCLHGGSCVKVTTKDGEIKHACDCQGATNSTHNFAGLFCEHASTSLCIVEDSKTSQGEDGKSLLSFCTNDGLCKKIEHKDDRQVTIYLTSLLAFTFPRSFFCMIFPILYYD